MQTLVRNHSASNVARLACHPRIAADSCAEVQKKYNIATELRDNIDILCNGPTYPIFLKKLVPVFMKLLEAPPVFMSTYMEHVSCAPGRGLEPCDADFRTHRDFAIAFWKYSIDYL